MLRSIRELNRYVLDAVDGEIGRCKDFLFDDEDWTICFMVADTGKWLPKQKVVISPVALGQPDWASERIPVNLTKQQIRDAPPLAANEPVSRHYESRVVDYYRWPINWAGTQTLGASPALPTPTLGSTSLEESPVAETPMRVDERHRRSTEEVRGYSIEGKDSRVGHVDDLIVDDVTWQLRFVVVDTRNWLPGRKVLVPEHWVSHVVWANRDVRLRATREQIEKSPEFDPNQPINEKIESRLYDFYGRPKAQA